ncbi:uncharacterized protein LOC115882882 [Sitophilus oryzae]|uniref:Uncharacterized protein LOC115882882 n=1 Tax=Sitophilus oryzae TaxID=7048 RepID=A0A6J2XZS2_SITOR|nr:uncharacterized protein LOC115882882 [Sitophilus oryzae]
MESQDRPFPSPSTWARLGKYFYNSPIPEEAAEANLTSKGPEKTAQNEYTKVVKQDLLGLDKNTNINNLAKRIRLSRYSFEFNDIRANFPPSLTVLQIQKVVNPYLRKSFELTRQLKYDNIEPLRLYHGTKMINLSSICRNNLDLRVTGMGHRIRWFRYCCKCKAGS